MLLRPLLCLAAILIIASVGYGADAQSAASAARPCAAPSSAEGLQQTGGTIITPTRETPKEAPAQVSPEQKNKDVITALPEIVIDRKARTVTVNGFVCMRDGYLELFATANGIREWEALIELKAPPKNINLALILLGLNAGNPVTWTEKGEVLPPAGPVIRVFVEYEKDGKTKRVEANEWMTDTATDKMAAPMEWVYCGGATRNGHFLADYEGTVICTANFPTAVLDLPFESNSKGKYPEGLSFKCRTEVIPEVRTPVKVVLQATDKVIKGRKVFWTLVIEKDGKMTLDGEPSSLEDLDAKLTKKDEYLKSVHVQVDPDSAVGLSLRAMKIISKYNVEPQLLENAPLPGEGSSATSASSAKPAEK